MSDLHALPVLELRELYVSGAVSPVEVAQASLERAETVGKAVTSFITLAPESAMADARLAEAAFRRREGDVPALLGVPVAVKDVTALPRGFALRVVRSSRATGCPPSMLRRSSVFAAGGQSFSARRTQAKTAGRPTPETAWWDRR